MRGKDPRWGHLRANRGKPRPGRKVAAGRLPSALGAPPTHGSRPLALRSPPRGRGALHLPQCPQPGLLPCPLFAGTAQRHPGKEAQARRHEPGKEARSTCHPAPTPHGHRAAAEPRAFIYAATCVFIALVCSECFRNITSLKTPIHSDRRSPHPILRAMQPGVLRDPRSFPLPHGHPRKKWFLKTGRAVPGAGESLEAEGLARYQPALPSAGSLEPEPPRHHHRPVLSRAGGEPVQLTTREPARRPRWSGSRCSEQVGTRQVLVAKERDRGGGGGGQGHKTHQLQGQGG